MVIGIDANWLIYEKAGIGQYSYYLTRELLRQNQEDNFILFANFFRHFKERRKILEDLVRASGNSKTRIVLSHLPALWRDWLSQTNFPLPLLYRQKIDLYFSPYFSGMAQNGFKKQVVTVHDLVFLRFPEHRGEKLSDYYLKRTKLALEKSDKVIAVSQATKNDLVELLQVEPEKIEVVYEGVDTELFRPVKGEKSTKALRKYNINSAYILSVCTLEPRKNLTSLIDAYLDLPDSLQQSHKLVLVGKSGWNNTDLMRKLEKLQKNKKVIVTGYVAREDLPALYSNATVFAFPALYEGFGLPPLEAFACGCPVIAGNNSSLPEVVGEAGILINNTNELKEALEKVLTKRSFAAELSKLGLQQAQKFSWSQAAKETLKVIKEVV